LRLSNQDDHLRKEIEVALENDITIIPVMIDIKKWEDIKGWPGQEGLPKTLEKFFRIQTAEVASDYDFHIHMDRLIKRIEVILGETRAGAQSAAQLDQTGGEGKYTLGHNFVDGICTRCDRTQTAVEHFRWECKAEAEKSGKAPLYPERDDARKRAARAAKKEQRLKKGIEELGWGEAPQQVSLTAPALIGWKCPQGNKLSWTWESGAGGYLLQRGASEYFITSEDIYAGEELGFIDPLGQVILDVSLSPTRGWSPSFYYRVKAKAAPGGGSDSQWSNVVRI
jgi:hypothetical protein